MPVLPRVVSGPWVGLAVLAAALAGACGGAGTTERPKNLLMISIDTLRPDHLGCYGRGRDTSPTIDGLAAQGVRFTDVTSASPWTLPSHASMFTGLYPSHHGVKDHVNALADETVTLAEEFQQHGFQTFAVVNTYNIAEPEFGLRQGFDQFRYVQEQVVADPATGQKSIINSGEDIVRVAVQKMLAKRDPAAPFFLFMHFYDVHTDFTPSQEYVDKFVSPYSGKMKGTTDQLNQLRNKKDPLSEADLRWLKEMYDAEIRQLDDLLGRFLGELEQLGLAKDTLVVITSDHGEEFLEHGGLLHGRTQYQELLSIPLILSGPGVPSGKVVDAPVHLVDVVPTILAIFGFDSGMQRDGVDLTAAWHDPSSFPPERPLFGEADHNNRVEGELVVDIKQMVRRGDDKLCLNRHTQEMELYDLGQDPGEQQNLLQKDPVKAKELRNELEQFRSSARVGAQGKAAEDVDLELLETLGYVGDDEEEAASEPESGAKPAAPTSTDAASSKAAADPVVAMNAAVDALKARPDHDAKFVKVQHLLVDVETRSAGDAERLAAELFARAKNGEDFDALVKAYTNDAHPGIYRMTTGLSDFSKGLYHRSDMAQAFGDVAWKLQVGEIGVAPYDPPPPTGRETSPFGFHIIKRLE